VSPRPSIRPDLALQPGYHSPRVPAEVRLNVNESPYAPPEPWLAKFQAALGQIEFNRYPDRLATALRAALAEFHGVESEEIFCANGSNEALQCLLLAFGGPGRTAAMFEPTYALHGHISRLTGTGVVSGRRTEAFIIEPAEVDRIIDAAQPEVLFFCSPNNPTGRADGPELITLALGRAPGLVVVDEAYGQFSPWSALDLRSSAANGGEALVVVRTFSKTWSMAAARLGYLIASPEVVAACEHVALPYHLSAPTQVGGLLALEFAAEMRARVALLAEERGRLSAALAALPVETWPSDANFILFRPLQRSAQAVWQGLLDRSVLVRDCSDWPGLAGCLRVTVGTPEENDRFLLALKESC
jgi:histidinol-phosphate aminotransferase